MAFTARCSSRASTVSTRARHPRSTSRIARSSTTGSQGPGRRTSIGSRPGFVLPSRDMAARGGRSSSPWGWGCGRASSRWHLRPPVSPGEWEPLWEIADALKVPFTIHVGGPRYAPNPNPQNAVYPGIADVAWYTLCCMMGETLGHLTYNGMFEKYPDLHLVMTEGYAGGSGSRCSSSTTTGATAVSTASASAPLPPHRRSTRHRASI